MPLARCALPSPLRALIGALPSPKGGRSPRPKPAHDLVMPDGRTAALNGLPAALQLGNSIGIEGNRFAIEGQEVGHEVRHAHAALGRPRLERCGSRLIDFDCLSFHADSILKLGDFSNKRRLAGPGDAIKYTDI